MQLQDRETARAHSMKTEELHYIYQRIGFQYFTETLFEDAGNNFFNGQLDPRVLVSYYPDLRGNLFDDGDNVDLFAGVAEHMPKEASVEDISESPPSLLYEHHSIHSTPHFRPMTAGCTLTIILPLSVYIHSVMHLIQLHST